MSGLGMPAVHKIVGGWCPICGENADYLVGRGHLVTYVDEDPSD